jgi:hypothetical protein|tara:strand:+ start:3707 stop:4015 length:309 start_codon:yes stop_codon:yes gene_type:complete
MEELIDIGDKRLTSRDIYILKLILMNERGRYHSTDDAEPWIRTALDMLVLEGLIERTRSPEGEWMNEWALTDGGVLWSLEPDVQPVLTSYLMTCPLQINLDL